MKKILILAILWFGIQTVSFSYDWTYSVSVSNGNGGALKHFYLWLPPQISGVRGLILTAAGRITQLSGDSAIRKACAESELGILGCPNLDGNFNPVDTLYINNALEALAAQAKLPELAHVPLASYGTSVGGIFAWEVAFAYPGRFFGIIQDNAVYTKVPAWAPTGFQISTVPLLLSRGYTEPVGDKPWLSKDSVLSQRVVGAPATLILQAGIGHFSWTQWEALYMSKWLKKAVAARIPGGPYARTQRPVLNAIQEESGWLTDTNFTSTPIAVGSWSAYSGDKTKAFWHFDEEMANLWIQMHQGQFALQPQLGEFSNGTFNNCTNPWQTCTSLNLGDYTQPINPGALTNASLPVRYGVYNGAFSLNPAGLVELDPTLVDETATGWIVAIQEGNATRQGWERAVRFTVAKKNSGSEQNITAPTFPDVMDTASPMAINALASSGLPVVVRVKSGPAEIVNNQLVIKPFAGDSGAVARVIVRYGQGGNASFRTAALKTDTFLVRKTTALPTRIQPKQNSNQGEIVPNPGTGKVFWTGGPTPRKITVSDLHGRQFLESNGKELESGFDLGFLPKGIYLIQIQNTDGVGVRRWIRE